MTQTVTCSSALKDSRMAGAELGRTIRAGLNGAAADAVILFASAEHDFSSLLGEIAQQAGTRVIVGSSSAGEFTDRSRGEGQVSAIALRSANMRFAVGLGHGLSQDPKAAAREVVASFKGLVPTGQMPYRAALVMTDALAGHTEAMVDELTLATGGNYRFFGGGAGDDGQFRKTYVFSGTEAITDAVVALEILSTKPIGVGVSHGWMPVGDGLRVTQSDGARLVSLNGMPAVQAFEDHAAATAQALDRSDPLPFFLHNIIGIKSGSTYRLRVPLGINDDGSVSCAAAVPQGAIVHLMKTSASSAVTAAEQATRSALDALGGHRPKAALVFDCVATRLRLGNAFDQELKACADLLGPGGFMGCNTYGQIARAEGQFSGFHNCTAVVCVLPE
ncbi:MAG TPA: FIST N-terminal domain-containing protein [Solimonas sp.]|nr:FIST N-terminal domain-containing protein [Solimonas sp.]